MKIGFGTVALVAVVGIATFYLTRRSGNATQADEAAGIINAVGNAAQGIGSVIKGIKDTVN